VGKMMSKKAFFAALVNLCLPRLVDATDVCAIFVSRGGNYDYSISGSNYESVGGQICARVLIVSGRELIAAFVYFCARLLEHYLSSYIGIDQPISDCTLLLRRSLSFDLARRRYSLTRPSRLASLFLENWLRRTRRHAHHDARVLGICGIRFCSHTKLRTSRPAWHVPALPRDALSRPPGGGLLICLSIER